MAPCRRFETKASRLVCIHTSLFILPTCQAPSPKQRSICREACPDTVLRCGPSTRVFVCHPTASTCVFLCAAPMLRARSSDVRTLYDVSCAPTFQSCASTFLSQGHLMFDPSTMCLARLPFNPKVDFAKLAAGSVRAIAEYGFDSVKLDSGFPVGSNLTLWAELLNKTGRSVVLRWSSDV